MEDTSASTVHSQPSAFTAYEGQQVHNKPLNPYQRLHIPVIRSGERAGINKTDDLLITRVVIH